MAKSIGLFFLGAGAAALLGALPLFASPQTTALSLDGSVAPVRSVSVDGGSQFGKVASTELGLEFEFAATSAPMMRWAKESANGRAGAKSGVVYWLGAENEVAASRGFASAKVTRIAFPVLDAGNSAPLYVRMSADATTKRPPAAPDTVTTPRLKASRVDHYALRLGPLPCDRVAAVSPLVWENGRWSDVRLTIAMEDHPAWNDWYQAYLEGAEDPLNGDLTVLGPDRKTPVVRFDLKEVSVVSLKVISASPGDPPQFGVKLRAKAIGLG